MKKLFGKALAMAVMMSVFCGSAYAAQNSIIIQGTGVSVEEGSGVARIFLENDKKQEAVIWPTFIRFHSNDPADKSEADYAHDYIRLTNSDGKETLYIDNNGLLGTAGDADIGGNLTVKGTITAGTSGAIASGDTGLVNGGAVYTALQGYAENNGTGTNALAIGYRSSAASNYATAIGPNATVYQTAGVAIGNNTAVYGTGGIAIGTTSYDPSDSGNTGIGGQAGKFGVAVGAYAYGWEDSVALGFESAAGKKSEDLRAVAIGYQAKAEQWNSVALGAKSVATEEDSVSIGNDTLKRKIINVAAGENDTDAVNYSQIKAVDGEYVKADQTVAENFTALDDQVKTNAGDISTLKSDMTTAKSNISTLQSDMTTAKSDISTLQSDMTTAKSDISTLQSDMTTAKSDISTLQGDMTTAKSDISSLQSDMTTAQGDISTLQTDVGALDTRVTAVEGFAGDISALQSDVATNKTDISNLKSDVAKKADKTDLTAEETARKDADANLQNQIDALGGGSLELNNRINATNDRVDRVGATAAALAAINYQPMAKGQSQVAVGMGGYKGKKATALGLAYQISDRVSGSVAGAANGSEHMFNVGFNYLFGQHTAKDVSQCAVTPGSMSLKEAEMQATIDSQGAKITTLESEVAELKAMVKALAAK